MRSRLWYCALLGLTCLSAAPHVDPERVYPELKTYDEQGRPWRVAVEDWDGARARVARDAAWAEWLKQERAAVEAWMGRHRDRVTWVAGWSHDGVSPTDGTRLQWTEDIPGEQAPFFRSPSDPQVEITPKLFAWWVVQFRARHFEMMQRAARLYRLTGDDPFAVWTAAQLDFYADNYLKWEIQKPGGRLFWQTLTEATNLVKYTEAVRQLGDYLTPEHKQQLWERFFRPEVEMLQGNQQIIHNISVWQRAAVAQVAVLYDDEVLWREALDGPFGIRRQIAEGITGDDLWFEQSLGYNTYVVEALLPLFTTAGLHGRAAELAREMAAAENLLLSPTYLRFPTGQLPNPADSGPLPPAPDVEAFGRAYRVFPTSLGLREAAGRRGWDTLLDPPKAPVGVAQLPPVSSRNLESSRMVLLHHGRWQVFLHYGQLTLSHAQQEVLNYSAFFDDVDVTHDTGTTGYGSPLHRGYLVRAVNHNVPFVDGEGAAAPPRATWTPTTWPPRGS